MKRGTISFYFPTLRRLDPFKSSGIRCLALIICSLSAFSLISNPIHAQVDRYAVASGNWNQTSTWAASSGGAPGASVPVAGDFVFIGDIAPGISVTIPGGYNAACATLAIGASTNASNSLTLSGTTSILNVSGNLTINRPSVSNTNAFNVNAGTATVGGTLTLAGSATAADLISKIAVTTGTLTISTDLVFVTGNAASNILDLSGGAATLNLGGAFTGTAGTFLSGTSSTVVYNKSGAQTIAGAFGVYNNLTLSGSGAKTTTGITVNNILSMQGSATTTGTVATYGAASTLEYAGSALQITGTEFRTPWTGTGGVIINNSNGVRLNATKTITRGLTISAGQFDLNAFALTVGNLQGAGTITSVPAGAVTLTVGTDNLSTTFSGIIQNGSGTLALAKNGTGVLTLTGSNSYSGVTTINAGTLKLGAAGDAANTPLGTAVAGTSIIAGAVLDLNGFSLGTSEPLTLRGTGISSSGAMINSSSTDVTYSGLITLGAASSIIADAGDINITNSGTITGAGFGLTIGGSGEGSLSSIIGTTTGTLTKSGSGTWTLSGANTFTGVATIGAGMLKLGASTSILGTIANLTTVSSGAVLDLNGFTLSTAETLTLNGTGISNSGALTNTSATTVDYSGLLRLGSSSSIVVNNGNINLTATGTITGAGFNLLLDGSGDGILANIIGTTTGSVTKTGSGTWTFSAANTYTGATTVSAGTLKIAIVGGGIPNLSALTVDGTLDLNGNDEVVGSVAGSGTVTSTAAGTITFSAGGNNASTTFSGLIQDGNATVAFTKNGTGILILSGNNSYSGLTTISAGTIRLGSAGNATDSPLGNATNGTTITSGATLDLNGYTLGIAESLILRGTGALNVGALTNSSATAVTYSGQLTLGAATSIIINAGDMNLTNTSPITGATFALTLSGSGNGTFAGALATGTGTLTKSGSGTWTLSGASTFTGATSINAGMIKLGASTSVFGTIAGITTVATGAVLDLNGFTISSAEPLTLNGTGISGSGALTNTSATNVDYSGLLRLGSATSIVVNNGDINLTATGVMIGPGFSLVLDGSGNGNISNNIGTTTGTVTKNGTGTWTFSGANSYTGATFINAGILKIGIVGGGIPNTSAVTVTSTLDLNGNDDVVGSITGAGTITSSSSGTITLAAGGNNSSTTFSGLIEDGSATVAFTKNGTGILTLTGDNSYSGLTSIAAGTIKLGSAGDGTNSPIGNANMGTSITSGGVLDLNGYTLSIVEALTLRGTGIASGGALTNSSLTDVSYSGLLTLGAASSIITNAGDIDILNTGVITGATFALTIGGSGSGTLASIISTTTGTLTKTGVGTWTLSGANTYTGATTISAGILKLGASTSVLGTIAGITTVSNGAVLDLNGFTLSTAEPLTLNGSGISNGGALTNNSSTFVNYSGLLRLGSSSTIVASNGNINFTALGTVIGATFDLTIDGPGNTILPSIIGTTSGEIIKNGAGTLTLSGNNTFTGGTTLNAGGLNINSTQALGTVAGTFTINGGTIDNSTGSAITTLNNPQIWNASFTFLGTRNLNLGNGAITINSDLTITTDANTLTAGGVISAGAYDLVKAGAGSLNFGASAVTLKSLTINGGTLTSTSGTLNIAGDFENNGTFVHNSGLTNFNGSVAQNIGGSSTTTFNNLTLNNVNGVTLNNNANVNSTLTMTDGKLEITPGSTLNIVSGNAIAGSGFGVSKHVVTQVNTSTNAKGFLRIGGFTGSLTFPIGNGTYYMPVLLNASGSNDFNVCVFQGATQTGEPNGPAFSALTQLFIVDACWVINRNNGSSSTTLQVNWPDALEGSAFQGLTNSEIGISRYDGSTWDPASGVGNQVSDYSTRNSLIAFRAFGVGKVGVPLALNFKNIKAFGLNKGVEVDWEILNETEVDHYEIQRSGDGTLFNTVGRVVPATNNFNEANYSWIDINASGQTYFYRIKAVNKDGKVVYSTIVRIDLQKISAALTIYPNPVQRNHAISLAGELQKGNYVIYIFSSNGQRLLSQSFDSPGGMTSVSVDLPSTVQPGIYFLQMDKNGSKVFNKTFAVQ